MSEQFCDNHKCLKLATCYLGIRVGEHMAYGYFSCDEHQADAFWQVTKKGLQQEQRFDVILLDPDQAEVL